MPTKTTRGKDDTMLIQGKRGKEGKGYSLKDPNGTGAYYIIVWDRRTYNPNIVKWKREQNKERAQGDPEKDKGYSYVEGWESLGNINNPESWEKLYKHLGKVYGKEVNRNDIRRAIEEDYNRMEAAREIRLEECQSQYEAACAQRGKTPIQLTSIKSFKYHMKKLKEATE